jgi:hypothetical protein
MLCILLVASCASGSPTGRNVHADAGVDHDGADDGDALESDGLRIDTMGPVNDVDRVDAIAEGGSDRADFGLPFETVTIPVALAVPTAARLKVRYHGVGTQIYECTFPGGAGSDGAVLDERGVAAHDAAVDVIGDAGVNATADGARDASSAGACHDGAADAACTPYAWVLVGPNAVLFDITGTEVGAHTVGPTARSLIWTSKDGSAVTASAGAEDVLSNDAIPWLMSIASSHTGAGVFSDVTYVERVNTVGGLAPVLPCAADLAGMIMSTGYRADYYFYTGAAFSLGVSGTPVAGDGG